MAPASSKNLFLAAVVALSVYVPFETVAKVSLVAAAFLFVVDPIPPFSRLIAIVSCWVVLKLNKYHRDSLLQQQNEEAIASVEITTEGKNGDNSVETKPESKKDQ